MFRTSILAMIFGFTREARRQCLFAPSVGLGPSSQGVKLAADALHGASPEAQELGGFQDPRSLRKLPSHLPFGRAVYLRPTKPHALGNGSLEPGLDPLPNHRALELSKGSGHLEN
jgi:hypothetical protein